MVSPGFCSSDFTETGRVRFGRGGTCTQNDRRFTGRGLDPSLSPFRLPGDCGTESTIITSSSSSCGWAGLGSRCGPTVDPLVGTTALSWMDSYERQSMISTWNRYLSPTDFLGLTSCSTS